MIWEILSFRMSPRIAYAILNFVPEFKKQKKFQSTSISTLTIEQIKDRYRGAEIIYKKDMSIVVDCYDNKLKRYVIIKILLTNNRYENVDTKVVQLVKTLNVCNIVTILDIFRVEGPIEILFPSRSRIKYVKDLYKKEESIWKKEADQFEIDRNLSEFNRQDLLDRRKRLLEDRNKLNIYKTRFEYYSQFVANDFNKNFIVMERLDENILVVYRNKINPDKLVYLLFQLILIVYILDSSNIKHNDLTPRNILTKKIQASYVYSYYKINEQEYYIPLDKVDNRILKLTDFEEAKIVNEKCANMLDMYNYVIKKLIEGIDLDEEIRSLLRRIETCSYEHVYQLIADEVFTSRLKRGDK